MKPKTEQQIQQKGNPLGYEPVGKLLRKFAIPAVVSMLVNAVYNIVDQIFIGQGVGYLGNAATTVSFPIVTIILSIGTLLGAGGSAYAAIKLGEKKEEEAEHTLNNVFILLIIAGIIITAAGLIFLEPILTVFGATPKNMEYSKSYASIILVGTTFNLLGIGLSNMARTDGSPKISMYSMLLGAMLNVILDPIYIFVFKWGVAGAAIATITSQLISTVILIYYFWKKGKMRFHRSMMKLNKSLCLTIASLGISSCITQASATLLQIIMNNSLVYYGNKSPVGGDVALSAMGIVMKIGMIIISVCIGISVGSQPILGFNKGAMQPGRVRKTYLTASGLASVVTILGWLLCITVPDVLIKIFGTQDAGFTEFAIKCMSIYMAGVFTTGFQITSTGYFQATGQPLKASVLSMLRQLVLLIPMILILPMFFGLEGILYAGPIADITSGVVVFIFIYHEMKKLKRWEIEIQGSEGIACRKQQ